MFSTTGIVVDA